MWERVENIYFSGDFFINNRRVTDNNILDIFGDIRSIEQLSNMLEGVNGYFTLIIKLESKCLVATDPTVHQPIFYSKEGYISDNYFYINNQIENQNISLKHAAEVLLYGRVFNDGTIHQNINKIEPGEIIDIGKSLPRKSKKITDIHFDKNQKGQTIDDLASTLNQSFEMFHELTKDENIILYLSGGYDSRLVAMMLHKHDFSDVYAITGDWSSTFDMKTAERIADELGFHWEKIENTDEDLRDIYESEYWKDIYKSIYGPWTIEPQPYKVITLKKIVDNSDIPSSGYIVHGNTPFDGVNIPREILRSKKISGSKLASHILSENTCSPLKLYDNSKLVKRSVRDAIKEDFMKNVPNGNIDVTEFSQIALNWYLQQKSGASAALYKEYGGFDKWDPFTERSFLQFYYDLPIEYKHDKTLMREYTRDLNDKLLNGIPLQDQNPNSKIKSMVRGSSFENFLRDVRDALSDVRYSFKTTEEIYKNSRYTFIDFPEFKDEFTKNQDRTYLLAKRNINRSIEKSDEVIDELSP